MRVPEACLRRAIGANKFNVRRPILISAFVKGRKLMLKASHGDYSPTKAIKQKQKKSTLKAWKSNPTSRQYYVSALSILRALELAPSDVNGQEYRTVVSAGTIVVNIGRAL